jgi:hypothetical protein
MDASLGEPPYPTEPGENAGDAPAAHLAGVALVVTEAFAPTAVP